MNKNIKMRRTLPLVMTLIFLGLVLFAVFTGFDRRSLQTSLDESIEFAKLRINRYDAYQMNDQVKSLVRILDKTRGFSTYMAEDITVDQDSLDAYAKEQRLTGIMVLDQDLQVIAKTSGDENAESLWTDLITSSYVSEILDYPEKTYTTRLTIDDKQYDFAAVARKDDAGIVVSYLEKADTKDANGDLSTEYLFADFPLEMNGAILVCDDDKVISSTDQDLYGQTIDDLKKVYISSVQMETDNTIKIKAKHGTWYGAKDATGNYTVYVFFPAYQIFMTRNIVCGVYTLVAILILLLYILLQKRTENESLEREQKRLRIINAIGRAYQSIILVDLSAGKVEAVKESDSLGLTTERVPISRIQQEEQIREFVDEAYQERFLRFINMRDVTERLGDKPSITETFLTKSGEWILSIIIPQRYDEEGNIDAVLVANRNVTSDKEHEIEQDKALRTALASAEHANKAKTIFLNNMSHDIRTPMNAIIGFTALAVSHIDNKEHVLEYLRKINISGKHLLSLINDILDMGRIESGNVKIEETEVHLPDILHDLRAIIQGNISAKQQEIYIDTQDVVHEDIVTDKLRLNQVLLNIVSNAVKFTPPGGTINIRISEKTCQKSGYATYEFSIKDNGVGIDKDFQEHIFDSFARERTVTESGIQGTGLGLAIAKNIVDMMKGSIVINSEKGKGAEFIVTLDCKTLDTGLSCNPIPELRGARALVVDDDANTCISISKMLRKIEMQADWTTSGKEAVIRAQEAWEESRPFSVYIIDWLMPDLNGIETVRRIRRVIGNDTPIIILSAYDWSDIEDEAREAGVTAFVSKPLFLSELQEILRNPRKSAAKEKKRQENHHIGRKILLAEDNELNREIAVTILQEAGFKVDAVDDGIAAVEWMASAPEDRYDLILMDIQMPRMDGYTATKEIRTLSNNKKANIPIVALTANALAEDKKKVIEAGMNGHIPKPFNIDMVLDVCDEIFGDKTDQV